MTTQPPDGTSARLLEEAVTLDIIVDNKLVVEIKSTARLQPDSTRQLFGYLHATSLEVGLLLRFGKEARFCRVIYENRFKRRGGASR
jgi:GxxExxY protein